MSEQNQKANPKVKKQKSLDDEIAAAQERLNRLVVQKREKERKDLERNQKAVYALLRLEKLDVVPIEEWTAALASLRKLLKVEAPKTGAVSAPAPMPEKSAGPGEPKTAKAAATLPEAA